MDNKKVIIKELQSQAFKKTLPILVCVAFVVLGIILLSIGKPVVGIATLVLFLFGTIVLLWDLYKTVAKLSQIKNAQFPKVEFEEIPNANLYDRVIATIGSNNRIIVCGENLKYLKNSVQSNYSSSQFIQRSFLNDAGIWFRSQKKLLVQSYVGDDAHRLREEEIKGPCEDDKSLRKNIGNRFVTGARSGRIVVASCEVEASWQIPALFNFGCWNACPSPELHAAIWRYWQDKYDAHIVGLTDDTIEARVFAPPRSISEALNLAWEHYCYSREGLGEDDVCAVAASLVENPTWFFWWD